MSLQRWLSSRAICCGSVCVCVCVVHLRMEKWDAVYSCCVVVAHWTLTPLSPLSLSLHPWSRPLSVGCFWCICEIFSCFLLRCVFCFHYCLFFSAHLCFFFHLSSLCSLTLMLKVLYLFFLFLPIFCTFFIVFSTLPCLRPYPSAPCQVLDVKLAE